MELNLISGPLEWLWLNRSGFSCTTILTKERREEGTWSPFGAPIAYEVSAFVLVGDDGGTCTPPAI